MKNIKIMLSTIVVLAILSGCGATHENFIKQQDAWNGESIENYIKVAGYPESSYDLPSGNKVYIYSKKQQGYSSPSFSVGFGGMFGHRIGRRGYIGMPLGFGFPMGYGGMYDNEVVTVCQLYIETTKNGKIVKWSSKGNGCVARELKSSTVAPSTQVK